MPTLKVKSADFEELYSSISAIIADQRNEVTISNQWFSKLLKEQGGYPITYKEYTISEEKVYSINDIKAMQKKTETAIKAEAKADKEKWKNSFFGSYELPDGSWQSLAESDEEEELKENIEYQANGRKWFVI